MISKDPGQAQLKIYERLAQLDEETQQRISLKYYHGTRPWLSKDAQARRRRRKSNPQETQEE